MALAAEVANAMMIWTLSPLSWLVVAVAGLLLGAWRKMRRLTVFSSVLAVVGIFGTTPLASMLLVDWLERPLPQPDSCRTQPPTVAVVLGAGVDVFASGDDTSMLSIASRRRMEHALQWWRQAPGRSLVVTGGPSPSGGEPVSRLMVQYARELGDGQAITALEERSSNTWENAHNLAHMTPPLPRRVVLISSALHLPRATYAMRQAGFEVCPIPADSRRGGKGWIGYMLWPQSEPLIKTEDALHELVGLAYYRWKGWRQSS